MSGSGGHPQAGARQNGYSIPSKNSSNSFQPSPVNKKRQAARGNSPSEKRSRTGELVSNGRDRIPTGPSRPSGTGARSPQDPPLKSAPDAVRPSRFDTARSPADRALPASGASTPVSEAPQVPRMIPGPTRPTAASAPPTRTLSGTNKPTPADSHQKRMREQGIASSPQGIASIVAVRNAKSLQAKQALGNIPKPPQENGSSVGFQSQQQLEAKLDDLVAQKFQKLRKDFLDQLRSDLQFEAKDSTARDVVGRASDVVEKTARELRDFERKYRAHEARLDSFDTRLNVRLGQLDELKQDVKVANDKHNASIYRIERNVDQLSGQCKSLATLQENHRKLEDSFAQVKLLGPRVDEIEQSYSSAADANKLKDDLKSLNDKVEPILKHETTLAQIQPLTSRMQLLESKSKQMELNISELDVPTLSKTVAETQNTQKNIEERVKALSSLAGSVTELRQKQTELGTEPDIPQPQTLKTIHDRLGRFETRLSTVETAKPNSGHVKKLARDKSASPSVGEITEFKSRLDLLETTLKRVQSEQKDQKDRLESTETGVDENFGTMDERVTEIETKVGKLHEVMITAAQTAVKPTKDLVNSIQNRVCLLEEKYAGPDQVPNVAFILQNWAPLAGDVHNLKLALEDVQTAAQESAQKPWLSEDRVTQLITKETQSLQDAMSKLETNLTSLKRPETVHPGRQSASPMESNTRAPAPGPEMDAHINKHIEGRFKPLSELGKDMSIRLEKAEQDTLDLAANTAAQFEKLQPAVSQLQQSLRELQEKHITWRSHGDTQFAGMQHNHNALVTALTDLENRYQNISTESIYKRMVHWIQEKYPDAPNFLAALNQMKTEVGALREQVSNGSGSGNVNSGDTARLRQEVAQFKASLNGTIDSLVRDGGERRTAVDALKTKIATVQEDLAKGLRDQVGPREELAKKVTELKDEVSGIDKRVADLGDDLAAESTKLDNEDKVLSNRIAQLEGLQHGDAFPEIAKDVQKLSKELGKVDKLLELKPGIEQLCGQLPFFEKKFGKFQHDIKLLNHYIRTLNENSPRRPLGDIGEEDSD